MKWQSRDFFLTTIAVIAAMGVSYALRVFLPLPNLSLVFLVPALFAGVRFGLWPSLYAAVLSFAVYNFFFTRPYFTFNVYAPGDLATLIFYLAVAMITGNMAARLKKHMEELARMGKTLEESRMLAETEKLRSALLSSLSHDLRTPLSSIIGSATGLQELGEDLPQEERKELLNNILDEAERLNRFIQNLLDMTKLEHGGLKPNIDIVDFRDLLGGAIRRLGKSLPAQRIDIAVEAGLETVCVDPVLMEQVLVNIFMNTAKYALTESRVKVTLGREVGVVVLRIADEGPGVSQADREHIFDMFYRVRSGDTKTAGTGLGLSICRGLVEAHGGTIHMEASAAGTGACIVMTFPDAVVPKCAQEQRGVYG